MGGISICITTLYFIYVNQDEMIYAEWFAACLTILVLIGIADDRFDISYKLRMGVQAILTLVMVYETGMTLSHIGNALGFGVWAFPPFVDIIVTLFAVIGAINAFNMVDGIDGLLGEYFAIPEYIMFYTIVGCFLFHTYWMSHSFQLAKAVRKWKGTEQPIEVQS
ncbi:hypothetical protein BCT04_16170 [Vibrio breoganii]|nr:hypothetical protein BCT04_16170 [Vibrio breoganii]